jgi:hypothetical protein
MWSGHCRSHFRQSMALPKRGGAWFQRGSAACIGAHVASAPAAHWLVAPGGAMCAARSAGQRGVAIRWTQPGAGIANGERSCRIPCTQLVARCFEHRQTPHPEQHLGQ